MGHQHHLGSRLEGMLNGRQRGTDTSIAGDLAVFHRHVQVFTDQNAFACQIQVGHALEVHGLATSFGTIR